MPDVILFNANVITMNPAFPRAQLVAIEDDKILYVGRNNSLDELKHKKTKIIDCNGKAVLPSFIDAHCHLYALAESYITLNLEPCNNVGSILDIQAKIRGLSQQLPSGSWIRGRGYNEFYLVEKRHPSRWDLDPITSAHPIKLTHRPGHAHGLNSFALKLAGISKEMPDPPNGLIDRDVETGEPTGLLYRMGDFLSKKVPSLEKKRLDLGMKMANKELLSLGITSVQDASSHNDIEEWRLLNRWKDKGLLKPRVSMMLGIEAFNTN
jgi:hypothetical protein